MHLRQGVSTLIHCMVQLIELGSRVRQYHNILVVVLLELN